MLRDPAAILLWGLAPPMLVFVLSYLPERLGLRTPLAEKQPWGCRAAALPLVFAYGVPLLMSLVPPDFAERLVGLRVWSFDAVLLALRAVPVLPVLLLLRLHDRPRLKRVGLDLNQAFPLAAGAAAGYFLVVFLYSALRNYSSEGWSALYTNPSYGSDFYRLPFSHGFALILLDTVAAGVEEVVFRGFALVPIARVISPAGGVAATALFWSMAHFNVSQTLGLFFLGLVLGLLFYRTRSLVPSLTLHVLLNLGANSDFLFGRLRAAGVHWTNQQHFLYIGVGSLCLGLGLALTAYGLWHRTTVVEVRTSRSPSPLNRQHDKTKRSRLAPRR